MTARDVLGMFPPTPAVVEVNLAVQQVRAALDETLRVGAYPPATAMFGARANLETQRPLHDVLTINIESPAKMAPRDAFVEHLRSVGARCRADWLLLVLPGKAFIQELGVHRPIVAFVVEVRGRPTEAYLAIVGAEEGRAVVSSFVRVATLSGFEQFRYLLAAPEPSALN